LAIIGGAKRTISGPKGPNRRPQLTILHTTLCGLFVTEANFVMEMSLVFDARMAWTIVTLSTSPAT
jgi:hypothetical protein